MSESKIISGLRATGAGTEKDTTLVLTLTKGPDVPPSEPGVTVLRSRYARYRVLLTSPAPMLDPKTGRYVQDPSLFIQFNNFVAKLDEKVSADVLKLKYAMEHRNFGINKAFWLAEEEIKKVEDLQVAQAAQFLAARPELAQKVLEQLGGKAFQLPSRTDGKTETADVQL